MCWCLLHMMLNNVLILGLLLLWNMMAGWGGGLVLYGITLWLFFFFSRNKIGKTDMQAHLASFFFFPLRNRIGQDHEPSSIMDEVFNIRNCGSSRQTNPYACYNHKTFSPTRGQTMLLVCNRLLLLEKLLFLHLYTLLQTSWQGNILFYTSFRQIV